MWRWMAATRALPPDIAAFAGQQGELARLERPPGRPAPAPLSRPPSGNGARYGVIVAAVDVLRRTPLELYRAVARHPRRKRAASGQQLAGVVEEDDPVAQQAPALLGMSGHGVRGVTVGVGRRRAPGKVMACRGPVAGGTGSPCPVGKYGRKHGGPLVSVAHSLRHANGHPDTHARK